MGCQECDELRLAALAASRSYHELLGDVEAAHLRREPPESLLELSTRLKAASDARDVAFSALNNHSVTHQMADLLRLGKGA